jgi:hypothetical protein
MDTTSGTELITTYGTVDERRTMTEWLRRQLSLPDDGTRVDAAVAHPGWTMTVESGIARLSQSNERARRVGAMIAWAIVGLTGLIWYGSTQTAPAFGSAVALALTLLLASGAAWVTWSRREWLVRHGQLTSHRGFATWDWERTFKTARLEVVESTDSDNDDRYELKVIDERGTLTIAGEVNDEGHIVDLARWLSARTGFELTLPYGMRPRLTTPVTDDEVK